MTFNSFPDNPVFELPRERHCESIVGNGEMLVTSIVSFSYTFLFLVIYPCKDNATLFQSFLPFAKFIPFSKPQSFVVNKDVI